MKAKIYIVTWFSYTASDNYLYSDVLTFNNEDEAQAEFKRECNNAYLECQWGAGWDGIEDMTDEEREDEYEYDVDESRDPGTYSVSSDAYEGYHVQVSIEEKEIDLPEPTTKNHRGNDVPALTWKGWDVRKLYNEYLTILYEHEGDTDVTGPSRESFLAAQAGDKEDTYFAMAYNAWDELCSRYDGLRDSGLDWYCGASTVGFPNEFDIYIGTGNENDPA